MQAKYTFTSGVVVMLALSLWICSTAFSATLADRAFEKLRAARPPCADAFDFVVCGDTRSPEPVVLPKDFYTMIREWNALQPAFVVDTGDLILGGPAPDLAPMWDEFEKAVGQCKVPFFPVAGNHDINADPAVIKIYEDRIGPLTYAFTYGNSRFIVLNSEEGGAGNGISDTQLAWLKDDLKQSHAKNIFLFLHCPYFAENWDALWAKVAEAFHGYPVKIVFAGHEHRYRDHGIRDGVHYVVTGGGGAETVDSDEEGGFHHYLLVRVRGEQVSWSVIRPGSVFPEDVVTQAGVETLHKLQAGIRSETLEVPWGEGFDRKVTISIENPLQAAVSSKLTWTIPAGWHVDPLESPYTVAPGTPAALSFHIWADSPAAMRFPVPTFSTAIQDAALNAPIAISKPLDLVPITVSAYAVEPVTPDGVLTEWTRATPIPLTYAVGFDKANTDDLKAQIRLMWDEGHVYLAVEVEDNEFHQPYSGDIVWSADSVELSLAGWEWSFALTGKGPEVFLELTPERHVEAVNTAVKLGIRRDGRHMVYEAVFAAAEVAPVRLQPASSYRLSLLVNDLDPSIPNTTRHWVELTPGAGAHFHCPMVKVLLTK